MHNPGATGGTTPSDGTHHECRGCRDTTTSHSLVHLLVQLSILGSTPARHTRLASSSSSRPRAAGAPATADWAICSSWTVSRWPAVVSRISDDWRTQHGTAAGQVRSGQVTGVVQRVRSGHEGWEIKCPLLKRLLSLLLLVIWDVVFSRVSPGCSGAARVAAVLSTFDGHQDTDDAQTFVPAGSTAQSQARLVHHRPAARHSHTQICHI